MYAGATAPVICSLRPRSGFRRGRSASYVSPAVIEQYLYGRTLDDFRSRHLRVVKARDIGLDQEEIALLSLLRSWRIRRARIAA